MRSIDNLREYVLTAPSICSTTRAILVGYIDGIEREVADMVPLPVDADGVPIHVGDLMAWPYGETFEVIGIGGSTLYYMDDSTGSVEWTDVYDKRHHYAPTVEDVLREFAGEWVDMADGTDEEREVFVKYAAKLQLKEG